ncbi:hypothetical protein D915_000859 [Fasciola hepatica]|uniref:Uncharacterized protein n=1 Tax=Fasciola hepatica TaxID=6192 RepID=A0A4E0RKH9_FASHE|nr:hypothetical protein D915_000859 [Fasciola hepatica]
MQILADMGNPHPVPDELLAGDYIIQGRERLVRCHELARQHLEAEHRRHKEYYEKFICGRPLEMEVIPAEIIPEEYRTSLPRTTQTPSDLPHSSVGQKTPSDHDVNSPVQCRLELKMNPDTESRKRIQPRRQAQLNAKPIIDLSTSHIFDLSVDHSARKPRTKRRRRLIHADDDDEDDVTEDDHTDSAKKTTRVKRTQKPTKKTTVKTGGAQQRLQQQTDGRSPPVARVVEVLFAKPGRVAFRADAKHQQPTTLTSGQRNDPSKTARDGEFVRPKSVFDLSANQTINMSILPPTLDELRQREQAKKETQQSNDTENRKPSASISSPHVTVVLSPLKSTNGKDPNGPVLRGVLTEQNPNSHARSFKRRRLALVDDDDDQLEGIHTDPKGKTTSHEPSGTKTAKPFFSLSDAKQASEAVASRTESRSKRTAKT